MSPSGRACTWVISSRSARGMQLRENVGAADHDDLVRAAPQRVAARGRQRRVEAAGDHDAGARQNRRSRLTTMLVRPGSGLPIER